MDIVSPLRLREVDRSAVRADPSEVSRVHAELDAMYAIAEALTALRDEQGRTRVLSWAARVLTPGAPITVSAAAPTVEIAARAVDKPVEPQLKAEADPDGALSLTFDYVDSLFNATDPVVQRPEPLRHRRRRFRPRLFVHCRLWS